MSEKAPAIQSRIASIDQYRGYAIFGMLLVNFFGHFKTEWIKIWPEGGLKDAFMFVFGEQLHHHNEFMTYADTIAPIFMFVVGLGMRLSWIRREAKVGAAAARKSIAKRYMLLVLIAFAIYQGWVWDALMNIGLAGLLALLIVDRKPAIRIAYALGLILAYQLIFSNTSYGEWLLRMGSYGRELQWPLITTLIPLRGELFDVPINGGLIGHWSWAMMIVFGTIAYDIMATRNAKTIVSGLLLCSLALTIAGWGVRAVASKSYYAKAEPYAAACMVEGNWEPANRILSKSPNIFSRLAEGNPQAEAALEANNAQALFAAAEDTLRGIAAMPETPPRAGNEWVFSKNYMTAPFAFWATALCLLHLLGFYFVCDILKFNVPGMTVFGLNPLFIYIFQSLTLEVFANFVDLLDIGNTQSGFVVLGSGLAYFALIYGMALYLYKKNIIIKL